MHANRRLIRIGWGDCDPAGIVFYPRFFAIFDACTAELFASAGVDLLGLQRSGAISGVPMVDLRSRFLAPVRYGDEVAVDSEIAELGRSSFAVRHRLSNGGTLAVEAVETRVWTHATDGDASRLRAQPIPPEIAARLSAGR